VPGTYPTLVNLTVPMLVGAFSQIDKFVKKAADLLGIDLNKEGN
jgi:hypothetical protein